MGIKLFPSPVHVAQGNSAHCWAACTTSWLTVNTDRPQLTLKQLVDRYGDPKKGGSIAFNDDKWTQLTAAMRWVVSWPVAVVGEIDTGLGIRQLTLPDLADTIEARLFAHGYTLLVDNHTPTTLLTQGISHMYVVYGITALDGGGYELLVMDPSPRHKSRLSLGELLNHHMTLVSAREDKAIQSVPLP